MRYTIYDKERDCEITTPVGMRITDGPEVVEHFLPWREDSVFYRIVDTYDDYVKYCTQAETIALTLCSRAYLQKKSLDRLSVRRKYMDRFFIDPVPMKRFIKVTGRDKYMVTFYRWDYKESL